MGLKILVAQDGSDAARRALEFGIKRASATDGSLVIAHVLEWSPYSFLTPEELAERHGRRADELTRAEQAILAPVVAEVQARSVPVSAVLRYGHIAETLCQIAQEQGAGLIIIGRTGHSRFATRVFGSVAGTLAQIAPVPVTIVP